MQQQTYFQREIDKLNAIVIPKGQNSAQKTMKMIMDAYLDTQKFN